MPNMQPLPDPKVYAQELEYFPWGLLINTALAYVNQHAPLSGKLLDLMCGPGMLLQKIKRVRPDLQLTGVDFDLRYIEFAQHQSPDINYALHDVRTWEPQEKYDVITCTGALHHLPYEEQEKFVEKISLLLRLQGVALIGDPFIGKFSDEQERQINAAKLGHELLLEVLRCSAPDEIIRATQDITLNDILGYEFKTTLPKLRHMFAHHFSDVTKICTWSVKKSGCGDCLFILRKPRQPNY